MLALLKVAFSMYSAMNTQCWTLIFVTANTHRVFNIRIRRFLPKYTNNFANFIVIYPYIRLSIYYTHILACAIYMCIYSIAVIMYVTLSSSIYSPIFILPTTAPSIVIINIIDVVVKDNIKTNTNNRQFSTSCIQHLGKYLTVYIPTYMYMATSIQQQNIVHIKKVREWRLLSFRNTLFRIVSAVVVYTWG